MGKSCWIARLALQQLFPIQILLDLNCYQLLYSNDTDLKYSTFTYFFLLFSFLTLTCKRPIPYLLVKKVHQFVERTVNSVSFNLLLKGNQIQRLRKKK